MYFCAYLVDAVFAPRDDVPLLGLALPRVVGDVAKVSIGQKLDPLVAVRQLHLALRETKPIVRLRNLSGRGAREP